MQQSHYIFPPRMQRHGIIVLATNCVSLHLPTYITIYIIYTITFPRNVQRTCIAVIRATRLTFALGSITLLKDILFQWEIHIIHIHYIIFIIANERMSASAGERVRLHTEDTPCFNHPSRHTNTSCHTNIAACSVCITLYSVRLVACRSIHVPMCR